MNIEEELSKPNPLVKLLTTQWFLDRYRMAMGDIEQDPFVAQLFSDYIGRYELKALNEFQCFTLNEITQELQFIVNKKYKETQPFDEMVAVLMIMDQGVTYTNRVYGYDLCHIWLITCSRGATFATAT